MKTNRCLMMLIVAVLSGCAPMMQQSVYRDTVCVTRNGQEDCQKVERIVETNDPYYGNSYGYGSFYFQNGRTFVGGNTGYGGVYRGGYCGVNAFGIPMTCY